MNSFELKSLSHHAYCLIGGSTVAEELLNILHKEHGISIQGNSDLFNRRYESFTIDDARELKLAHEMRPTTNDGKKIFIITADNINSEAQNALLKLLEEPADYAHFFLIIPSAHLLLPTVKSRLSMITINSASQNGIARSSLVNDSQAKTFGAKGGGTHQSPENDELIKLTKIFVTSSVKDRLEIVKKLLDDISKEKKTKQDAINFLNFVQEIIYEKGKSKGLSGNKGDKVVIGKSAGNAEPKDLEALIATETARKYVNDRSPSLKMLLEYVAMSV